MEFDKLYNEYIYSPYDYCNIDDRLVLFTDKEKTGISIIDEHHDCLAGAINMLFDCMRHDAAKRLTLPAISAFKYNMGVHYQTERCMLSFSDEAYAPLYDMKYFELCRRFAVVECQVRKDFDVACLLRFLKAWWLQHMESHAEFFKPCSPDMEYKH